MNAFVLKIIALVTMVIDHMGAVFPETFGFEFRVIGRIAFPIYVFLIAEGFRHTKNPKQFLVRLFAFAIISEPVFDWAIRGASFPWGVNFLADTNIFYTLFFGGAAIVSYEKIREKFGWIIAILPVAAFALLAEYVFTSDYGAYGVVFIFIMYVIRHKNLSLAAMAALCVWQHEWIFRQAFAYGFDTIPPIGWMLIPATLVSVLLVAFYNGKRGLSLKWFFYVSYPVHLAVLAVVLHL